MWSITIAKAADHVVEEVVYTAAEPAHAFQHELELQGVFSVEIGVE